MRLLYRRLVAFTSLLTIALGVALLVVTAVHGGGIGYVIGGLFVAAGAGRLTLQRRGR